MTIVGVTCVKNEEDIIEAFVRHNLAYLDKLIVLNHGSTDRTGLILTRLLDEGLPLIVEDDPSLGKFQGEKMTRLMRRAVNEHAADWVLLLDADEFIRCPADRLPLPGDGTYGVCLKIAVRTYQAHESDDHAIINPVERIRHRLQHEPKEDAPLAERRYFLKAIVPRSLALTPGAVVVQGNHFILNSNSEAPHEFWPGFDYAHYSLRSVGQYTSKIAVGTMQQIYRSSPRGDMDSFYLTHLEELRSDFEGFSRRFYERAPSYLELAQTFRPDIVHDPLGYRGGPLRHTSPASDYTRLVSNLIGYAETLAGALAQHASANPAAIIEVEEVARLELRGNDATQSVVRTITSGSHHAQTLRFPLAATSAPSTWMIEFTSQPALLEVQSLRWLREDGSEADHDTGEARLSAKISIRRNACHLHHRQYYTFIKGAENTVLELQAPPPAGGLRVTTLEVGLRMDTDSTRIGVRLMHNDNLDRLLAAPASERIAKLERKLAERSSFAGACGFQIYRLWRALTRSPKRKPAEA